MSTNRGAPAWRLDSARGRHHGSRGFTLIETLVVLLICVGLVALMAGLYKAVGKSALALRSGQQEWMVQRQLREQLLHLFVVEKSFLKPVTGESEEIYLTTWQSRADGLTGKPILAYLHYDEDQRTLYYQEQPLPAWWSDMAASWDAIRLQSEVRASPSGKVVTGVEKLSFLYLPEDAVDLRSDRWVRAWRKETAPKLIQMNFTKAGRNYTIWFGIRAIDA